MPLQYLKYGKCLSGFLEPVEGPLHLIQIDTGMVPDSLGLKDTQFLRAIDDTIEFITVQAEAESRNGIFQLGVNLDILPPVPWLPVSCRVA